MEVVFFILLVVGFASSASFPEKWERCKVPPELDGKRNECLERTIRNILVDLGPEGEKSLGMKRFEPFRIKKLTVGNDDPASAVNLRVDFTEWDLHGLSKAKNIVVSGKYSSAKDWHFKMDADLDSALIVGHYKVNGKVLIFPLVGEGNSTISLTGIKVGGESWGQPQIKNGKEYVKIIKNKFYLDVKKVIVNFENLLGNKEISDNMNMIINQNIDFIFKELLPDIERGIEKELAKYGKKIMEKIPYSELILS